MNRVYLLGYRILVFGDDDYRAFNTARAVQGTRAEVIGPFPTEEDATKALAETMTAGVNIGINLGKGPSFELAVTLKQRGIPFVFITGYDEEVISPEFDGVPRLQEPIELRQVIGNFTATLSPPA